jgi:hypothetical protein
MRVGGARNAPAASPQGKRLGIYCRGGWVDHRAGLDGRRKSYSHRDTIPEIKIYSRLEDLLIALNGTSDDARQGENESEIMILVIHTRVHVVFFNIAPIFNLDT